ncbi:MAG: undecaprenyldiphospho-muramoylpentapeptide beta-N-acetylglucosaminyltransferase [Cryomorphaceae bacterium]|nr:undecaprenyldiphospho-muramoylpentapeptide beta-N-acetylglucosaminyltransferase [Cryomorphaceae bacterium]|tara:strand:- start:174 stop:1298 length:1125 start_codon:yes stop_codon:yes gene_type:complete
MNKTPNIIISGGGTGGHIFPAISIAKEIIKRHPKAKIQFIGAKNRMEMTRVPKEGFPIFGINIAGFQRKAFFKNISLPIKIFLSLFQVYGFLRKQKADAVIGTGGYVSGPTLFMAQLMGIPTIIQEQNSLAGWTNRVLGKKAKIICVAYNGMEKFFPLKKIQLTGNPVRNEIAKIGSTDLESVKSIAAKNKLGFNPKYPLILVLGGSQGAKEINRAIEKNYKEWNQNNIQILWQSGDRYYNNLLDKISQNEFILIKPFLNDMNLAYLGADLIISRAGAGTISELCCVGAASILIPSPNVSEDHQTRNAKNLSDLNAALFIDEKNAINNIRNIVLEVVFNHAKLKSLRSNILQLSKPNATEDIVDNLEKYWLWKN